MLVFQIQRYVDREFQIPGNGLALRSTKIGIVVILLGFKGCAQARCQYVLLPEQKTAADVIQINAGVVRMINLDALLIIGR